jgi:amino acid adenylation domain-containing protein/thioester reductase-like protein
MLPRSPSFPIHQLIEHQVTVTPDAVAIAFQDQALTYHQITYAQLNTQANQLAHYLKKLGVKAETLVGLYVERSPIAIIGMLAILKAGGAYVPLDPTYPRERIALMLEDSQLSVILTQSRYASELSFYQLRLIYLDTDWSEIELESPFNLGLSTVAKDLAYVIYTSGSTGKPKGVMIEHGSLTNFVQAIGQEYDIMPSDKLLQFASISFDVAVEEIFVSLVQGATLVLRSQEMLRSISTFLQACQELELTVLNLPTAFWHQICVELPLSCFPETVRLVVIGSERASPRWLNAWREYAPPQIRLINAYGPTEATVSSTVCDLSGPNAVEVGDRVLPIGKAIDNVQTYVLDAELQPVEVGVTGELYIAGAGLARGYLDRPDLTAAKFIDLPLGCEGRIRLYKTGDLVRCRPDGNLEFLDRTDHQEKIRGFRIELSEIETVLDQHPDVQQSIVIAREDIPGEKRLVGYVVPNANTSTAAILDNLVVEHLTQWQTIHSDDYFNEVATHWDSTFNISGWVNSYTGQPIPDEEMREWVDQTVDRILSLHPQNVLEIGCGTGLMLFRIAPYCQTYVGTDFSPTALRYVQQQIPKFDLSHVSLLQCSADDLQGVKPSFFDTVIINSVIQYFPSVDYLVEVVEKVLQVVEPGGAIFIGDVRSYSLLPAFATGVELHQIKDDQEISELRRRIQARLQQEEELTLDPEFFYALQHHYPEITQVHVRVKEGRFVNELTQFRYDVLLQIAPSVVPKMNNSPEPEWLNWQKQNLSLSQLKQRLQTTQPEALGVRAIPNYRVLASVKTVEWLSRSDCPQSIAELRQVIQAFETNGVDPQDLWQLSQELNYAIAIHCSSTPKDEVAPPEYSAESCYEVVLYRCSDNPTHPWIPLPPQPISSKPWQTYANNPLQGKIVQNLVPQLRSYLQGKLPSYMVPAVLMLVEQLPLTLNGKINRRELPVPSSDRPPLEEAFVAPRTVLEQELASLWSTVLGVTGIGINDNFFELGGDSLRTTQLIFRIETAYQVVVALIDFFAIPTISGLASIIHQGKNNDASPTDWMSLSQLQVEAELDPLIQPQSFDRTSVSQPRRIFLTGATGFVGSFLLHELLQQTQATIYCLVRAQNFAEAYQKLQTSLEQNIGKKTEFYTRIVPVVGDLAKPRLGLTESQFQSLANSMDAIYHSGASVNLLYPYPSLRDVNVIGTHEILKLASCGQTKPLHYLSTLDVFESVAATGIRVIYEQDAITQGQGLSGGYAQSKWIAEQLVTQAAARGLPICIYRPGLVTGHSQSGYSNTEDLVCRLVKSFIQLQQAPDLDLMVDMTPVDYASQAIVHLSLQPKSLGQAFHLVNPQPFPLNQLVTALNKVGYLIQQVPYPQWQDALRLEPNALKPLVEVVTERICNSQLTRLELWLAGNQSFDCYNSTQGLQEERIVCPPANQKLLDGYLAYFVQSGFLEAPKPSYLPS